MAELPHYRTILLATIGQELLKPSLIRVGENPHGKQRDLAGLFRRAEVAELPYYPTTLLDYRTILLATDDSEQARSA
jgi:hypothetical protein